MSKQQTYQNHARNYPLVHFILFPIFFFNFIWQAVRLYQEPSWDRSEMILLAFAFIGLNLAARAQALRAQDRVVRLEEKLRYRELLPKELAEKASELKTGQIIALRFASDEELPDLVQKTVNGEFPTNKEIKLAVKDWRGDFLRV
jgi:hypothetical protein